MVWYSIFLDFIWQIGITVFIMILAIVLYKVMGHAIARHTFRRSVGKRTEVLTRKALAWITALVAALIIVLLWGGSLENFWISLTSIIAVVAIGFFAVWSILSNVVAGVILLVSRHINVEDQVELMPDGVKGRIKDISLMFVTLESGGDKIQVPNNLMLQRMVKIKIRSKKDFFR